MMKIGDIRPPGMCIVSLWLFAGFMVGCACFMLRPTLWPFLHISGIALLFWVLTFRPLCRLLRKIG